jgi:Sigma-54 interaction domain/FHA domain/Homeodomain-like domain
MVASAPVAAIHEDVISGETLDDTAGKGTTAGVEIEASHLFVALECARPAAGGARHSLADVGRVVLARSSTRCADRSFAGGHWTLSVGIPDPRMSARHACLVRVGDEFFVEDLGSRNGTRVNGTQLSGRTALADGDLVEVGHTLLRYRSALSVPIDAPADADSADDAPGGPLRTLDPGLSMRAAMLASVARSNSPVLLLGETGTGKEVLARAVHRLSERRGAFVAVNCGALPASLLEAQLFGHLRGAFSGALTDAPGLLRSADGGTLLLDEVGDLPEPSQPALLRALQEKEVVPVGGVRPIPIDLRVVAATHRALDELERRGEFRSDLLARIAGFVFAIPPLRERKEDIGVLVEAFARGRAIRLKPAAGRALFRYHWPLNVRELHQTLEVAATLAGNEPIDIAHLPATVARAPTTRPVPLPRSDDSVERVRKRLVASLARHRGNVSEVARELGKARTQVQRWLKRFGLDARGFR